MFTLFGLLLTEPQLHQRGTCIWFLQLICKLNCTSKKMYCVLFYFYASSKWMDVNPWFWDTAVLLSGHCSNGVLRLVYTILDNRALKNIHYSVPHYPGPLAFEGEILVTSLPQFIVFFHRTSPFTTSKRKEGVPYKQDFFQFFCVSFNWPLGQASTLLQISAHTYQTFRKWLYQSHTSHSLHLRSPLSLYRIWIAVLPFCM